MEFMKLVANNVFPSDSSIPIVILDCFWIMLSGFQRTNLAM